MISLVDMARFLPLLRQKITGPLDVMMLEALLSASIKFCRESLLAQEQISLDAPVVGDDLALLPEDGQVKSCNIISVTTPDLPDVGLTPGQDYMARSDNTIRMLRTYTQVDILCAIEPTRTAAAVPRQLWDDYADAVTCGAAVQLFLNPDKPWTDPKRAAIYQPVFVEGYRDARRFRQNVTPPTRSTFNNPVRKHSFY